MQSKSQLVRKISLCYLNIAITVNAKMLCKYQFAKNMRIRYELLSVMRKFCPLHSIIMPSLN